jgi:hypothetical protein
MISYTVFRFTQRAIENRSTCHAWHACRRLPTPDLYHRAKYGRSTWNSVEMCKEQTNKERHILISVYSADTWKKMATLTACGGFEKGYDILSQDRRHPI